MNQGTAERWVTISALIVIAVYGYRRVTEAAQKGGVKNIIGLGNPVPVGEFITAWGFTFLVVSIMASASPSFGGAFAILIMAGDLLVNTSSVVGDIQTQEGSSSTASSSGSNPLPGTSTTSNPAGEPANLTTGNNPRGVAI